MERLTGGQKSVVSAFRRIESDRDEIIRLAEKGEKAADFDMVWESCFDCFKRVAFFVGYNDQTFLRDAATSEYPLINTVISVISSRVLVPLPESILRMASYLSMGVELLAQERTAGKEMLDMYKKLPSALIQYCIDNGFFTESDYQEEYSGIGQTETLSRTEKQEILLVELAGSKFHLECLFESWRRAEPIPLDSAWWAGFLAVDGVANFLSFRTRNGFVPDYTVGEDMQIATILAHLNLVGLFPLPTSTVRLQKRMDRMALDLDKGYTLSKDDLTVVADIIKTLIGYCIENKYFTMAQFDMALANRRQLNYRIEPKIKNMLA